MSFGCGVGDVIAVSTLAWKIYRACKDSSNDFKNISTEVASLHVILKELEENLSDQSMSSHQPAQLSVLAGGCNDVFKDLDALLERYKSLGTKTQRTWDRMKWGLEDIQSIRERLVSNVSLLTAFNTTLQNSSQARIVEKLNTFMAEIRAGMHEGSVISSHSIQSVTTDDKEAWRQLQRELEDIGISAAVLKQHQQFIVKWFRDAVEAGALIEENDAEEGSDAEDERGAVEEYEWKETEEHTSSMASQRHGVETLVDSRTSSEQAIADSNKEARARPNQIATASISISAHPNRDRPRGVEPKRNKPRPAGLSYVMNKLFGPSKHDLIVAVQLGDVERVNRLLSNANLNVHSRLGGSNTALHWAAIYGRYKIALLLLNQGAEIEAKGASESTALHRAAKNNHRKIVELLLDKGADIEAKDRSKHTALHEAARWGQYETVELLLTKGADIDAKDSGESTALHLAALCGGREVVELLLTKGAYIDARDKNGQTPLHLGVSGTRETVQLLVDRGAKLLVDGSGRTPLQLAIINGSWMICIILKKQESISAGGSDRIPRNQDLALPRERWARQGYDTNGEARQDMT